MGWGGIRSGLGYVSYVVGFGSFGLGWRYKGVAVVLFHLVQVAGEEPNPCWWKGLGKLTVDVITCRNDEEMQQGEEEALFCTLCNVMVLAYRCLVKEGDREAPSFLFKWSLVFYLRLFTSLQCSKVCHASGSVAILSI
ncbi:hypothetical protein Hdeb2414_s0007g00253791 [Helianthus debilis subsp. tardiflorus]